MNLFRICFLVSILASQCACSNSYLGRIISLRTPDVNDHRKLPSRPILASEQTEEIRPTVNSNWMQQHPFLLGTQTINESTQLDQVLRDNHTTAFILLENGKIIDERYYQDHSRNSEFKCFSISKSVLSAMFGIAQARGLINESDRLDQHVQNIENPKLAAMQLKHLLDNVSGFKYQRGFAPWKQQPRMYYSTDVKAYLNQAEIIHPPGSKFEGEDLSPLWLGVALEAALKKQDSKMSLSRFVEINLWQAMGASFDAKWVLDRADNGFEKTESGLVARAIDFAKFGQLYLNNGSLNGNQIVPADWIAATTKTPQKGQPNLFSEGFYQNLWWGYFRAGRRQNDFYANGHFGQRIYISPDHKLVLVRLGSESGEINWTDFLASIADTWNKEQDKLKKL